MTTTEVLNGIRFCEVFSDPQVTKSKRATELGLALKAEKIIKIIVTSAQNNRYKKCVTINDPLGQTHSPASSNHYSYLKIVLVRKIFVLTDVKKPRAKIVITTGRAKGRLRGSTKFIPIRTWSLCLMTLCLPSVDLNLWILEFRKHSLQYASRTRRFIKALSDLHFLQSTSSPGLKLIFVSPRAPMQAESACVEHIFFLKVGEKAS